MGCGWLGLPLAVELVNVGYHIFGSTTSTDKIKVLQENGITPFLIHIENSLDDLGGFLDTEVLIIAITSKSIPDMKNLIKKIKESEVQKVLFISSTSVYPFMNGIVTEATETANTPLAEIEQLFITNKAFKTTILRFGGVFGYDRQPGRFIKKDKPVEQPEGYVNLIHKDDCIEIIKQIILKNVWNEVLNACADSHPKRRDFYLREVQKLGEQSIAFNENGALQYKIIDSRKMIELLNYKFKYGDLMLI